MLPVTSSLGHLRPPSLPEPFFFCTFSRHAAPTPVPLCSVLLGLALCSLVLLLYALSVAYSFAVRFIHTVMSPFREPWCIFDEYSYPDHFQSHYRIYPKTARRRNHNNRKGRSTGRKGAHAARWVGRRRHKVPRRVKVGKRNGKRLGSDPLWRSYFPTPHHSHAKSKSLPFHHHPHRP